MENYLTFLLMESPYHSLCPQIILSDVFLNFASESIMAAVKQTAGRVLSTLIGKYLHFATST